MTAVLGEIRHEMVARVVAHRDEREKEGSESCGSRRSLVESLPWLLDRVDFARVALFFVGAEMEGKKIWPCMFSWDDG